MSPSGCATSIAPKSGFTLRSKRLHLRALRLRVRKRTQDICPEFRDVERQRWRVGTPARWLLERSMSVIGILQKSSFLLTQPRVPSSYSPAKFLCHFSNVLLLLPEVGGAPNVVSGAPFFGVVHRSGLDYSQSYFIAHPKFLPLDPAHIFFLRADKSADS